MRSHRFIVGEFVALSAVSLVFGAAHKIPRPAPSNSQQITWINNDQEFSSTVDLVKHEPYLSVEQLARMADAQVQWQNVSERACLTQRSHELCFDWKQSQVTLNGQPTRTHWKVLYSDNRLLIPVKFATSKTFERFSNKKISWNSNNGRLEQHDPVTVAVPPIEDLGDRYRLAIKVKQGTDFRLLQNDSQQIWVRFIDGQSEGSQILEGDNVIKEVQINQHRKSVDLQVVLGAKALSQNVYFDKDQQSLIVEIGKPEDDDEQPAPAPVAKSEPPRAAVHLTAAAPVPAPVPVPAKPKLTVEKRKPTVNRARTYAVAEPAGSKLKTVVVDAGHGGIDCGAIGTRGTFEKEINLRVAKALAEALKKENNIRVILTRDKDEFIPLSERTEIANHADADLFVSIHCNSSLSPKTTGFEVYILSPDATDQAAEAVARIENSVVSLESKSAETSRISRLLASMAVYNFINESSKCANFVCKSVRRKSPVDQTSVKEANFHVLRGAQMPGVLVELEFLSNPFSELRLRSTRFQNQVVKGLADGVHGYLQTTGSHKQSISNELRQTIKKAER